MIDGEALPPVSATVPVHIGQEGGTSSTEAWELAVEVPVQITVNGAPFTVLLATPADLDDLALGVLLTEQVLAHTGDVTGIQVSPCLGDVLVDVQVRDGAVRTERLGARSILGNSGCGLCGIESLAQLHARTPRMDRGIMPITDEAIRRAFTALPAHQPLNARTRSVHAAAWCEPDGHLVMAREDVGRHNALDKLVGALAARDRLSEPGFVVMSSRCSYELVYKAAVTNAQLLATISAPTTMAQQWATALHMPLACALARGGEIAVVRTPDARQPALPPSP